MNNGNMVSQPLHARILPPTGVPHPMGPSNFPQKLPDAPSTPLSELQQLRQLLANMMDKNSARVPLIRSGDVTSTGQTFDWSMMGDMERLMIRNKGTNSVWIAFEAEGTNVDNFTSDGSIEIQAQEAWSFTQCKFQKIGLRCSAGQTATVHAVAFQKAFGDFGGAIV